MPYYGTPGEQAKIDEAYPQCENISVDYAIMEKAEEIFVCPAEFGWSDLGTWGSLWEQSKRDLYGNACIGNNIKMFDSHNCIVHTTQQQRVVIQGLDDCIVARTRWRFGLSASVAKNNVSNNSANNTLKIWKEK